MCTMEVEECVRACVVGVCVCVCNRALGIPELVYHGTRGACVSVREKPCMTAPNLSFSL